MKKTVKKWGAALLCLCMLLGTLGMVPAKAETQALQTIDAFVPLPDEIAIQRATVGTAQGNLHLPNTLSVTISGTQVNAAVASWTASPEYNPDTAGSYIFTPTLEAGYSLAPNMTAPSVEITTEEQDEPSVVFTMEPNEPLYLPEGQAVTKTDLLAGVSAADENRETVEVTVQDTDGLDEESPAPKDDFSAYTITYAAAHPETDEVFTATREAYVTADILRLALGGNFTITKTAGGDPDPADDYEYSDHVLTIKSGTPMTISGTTTADTIKIGSGVQADLTLNGVNINVSNTNNACALDMSNAGTSVITLADGSMNVLKSGNNMPGVYVPDGVSLTIEGDGTLDATGGGGGAGIGGNSGNAGGTTTING
ncbi:MAG: carbohydrate-binding domain-containing protein, partial [Lachnospiraceae bacterium]